MSSEPEPEPFRLTDPQAMRAIAHPVRMALLELFAVHDKLTATQASEALGESPANCAFHLRTLAKYGFVTEAGGGRGRERPWKPTSTSIRLQSSSLEGEQAHLAADALGQVFIDRLLGRIRSAFAAKAWPAEWESAVQSSQALVFLTPRELEEASDELLAIINRYVGRRENPQARPAGALPVEFGVFAYPRHDLAQLLPAEN
jgi:predicted ArsR family transcriptional regulator